ncbi:MAG: hypothetical protein KC464_27535, partial [Myxococcales bacterium]|nr:hypothetical protein [Myxococcales bacterium]
MAADGYVISLVSRCSSVEEFVSAFRSYVHRDHVFVPTTQPVAAGRTVRLAITLADHTPVLAGEVEVLSSSTIPQGPHQKPGLRLRFQSLDGDGAALMRRFERPISDPGLVPHADPATVPSGARADILASPQAPDEDPTGPATCSVIEASAPIAVGGPERPARIDLTPLP